MRVQQLVDNIDGGDCQNQCQLIGYNIGCCRGFEVEGVFQEFDFDYVMGSVVGQGCFGVVVECFLLGDDQLDDFGYDLGVDGEIGVLKMEGEEGSRNGKQCCGNVIQDNGDDWVQFQKDYFGEYCVSVDVDKGLLVD